MTQPPTCDIIIALAGRHEARPGLRKGHEMTHRIINAHCNQNGTTPAFNFAGEDAAYYWTRRNWYTHPVALIAENWKTDTIVIGWAPGYIKGADKTAEEEVEAIISKLEE